MVYLIGIFLFLAIELYLWNKNRLYYYFICYSWAEEKQQLVNIANGTLECDCFSIKAIQKEMKKQIKKDKNKIADICVITSLTKISKKEWEDNNQESK